MSRERLCKEAEKLSQRSLWRVGKTDENRQPDLAAEDQTQLNQHRQNRNSQACKNHDCRWNHAKYLNTLFMLSV